jgi:hypothetical protein
VKTEASMQRQSIVYCAWCERIRTPQGYWKETSPLDPRPHNSLYTHGICPHCKRVLLTQKMITREK